jgi:hypothetical protein
MLDRYLPSCPLTEKDTAWLTTLFTVRDIWLCIIRLYSIGAKTVKGFRGLVLSTVFAL